MYSGLNFIRNNYLHFLSERACRLLVCYPASCFAMAIHYYVCKGYKIEDLKKGKNLH